MRVQFGPYGHEATDGTYCTADQPLSREQVDLIVGLMRQHNRCPDCVRAIEMHEGSVTLEHPCPPEHRHIWTRWCDCPETDT